MPDHGPGTGTNYEKRKWNTTFRSEIPTRENGPTFLDFPLFPRIFQWDDPTKLVPFTAEPEIPEIAVYAMCTCYSVINPCRYWTSRTLSVLASNGNTLYNVMGVKRHILPVDIPKVESISRAEINLTV